MIQTTHTSAPGLTEKARQAQLIGGQRRRGPLSLLVASGASAATTVHFFDKQVSSTFRGPNGQPLGPQRDADGRRQLREHDLYYVGNHKHHAKKWTATGHLVCTTRRSLAP